MPHVLALLGQAVGLFISTDLDDVLVLLVFFADPRFRIRQVVAGQFIGIAMLYAVSVAGAWATLLMPRGFIGLLGLVPITMGLKSAWELWFDDPSEQVSDRISPARHTNIAAVVAVTVANGGDNVSVYIPLFALRSAPDIALMGVVFAVMTALWLGLAYWLTRHRMIGAPVRRYTRLLMPFVFVTMGLLILYQAGTLKLLKGFMF
ncbi:MAG TPA: cadmium resistance transporter [Steroidobacteraceae bacterium]|nr:cadmium resistance transporter [Steroidobacteraceae bacterium]